MAPIVDMVQVRQRLEADPRARSNFLDSLISLFGSLFSSQPDVTTAPLPPTIEHGPVTTPIGSGSTAVSPTAPAVHGIHIGLNRVDPSAYAGWHGPLNACEQDARDMKLLTDRMRNGGGGKGSSLLLLTKDATRAALETQISILASSCSANDFVILTYSGHGGQVVDDDGDESDSADETWCLYDGEVLDDSLNLMLCRFQRGVNIVVISDSCHSGTITRAVPSGTVEIEMKEGVRAMPSWVHEMMKQGDRRAVLRKIRDDARAKREVGLGDVPAARVLLLSGCAENQLSYDGQRNGAFTAALLAADKENPQRSWRRQDRRASSLLPDSQSPQFVLTGTDTEVLAEYTAFKV